MAQPSRAPPSGSSTGRSDSTGPSWDDVQGALDARDDGVFEYLPPRSAGGQDSTQASSAPFSSALHFRAESGGQSVSTAPVSAVDSTAPLSRGAGDGPPRSAGDEDADDTLSPAAVYALAASRQLASADGSLRHRVPIRRNVGFHAPDPFHRVGSPQRHWALNIDTTGLDKTPVYKIGDHDRADPLDGLRAATGDSAATRSKASSSAASVDHRGVPAYNDQIQLESVAHHGYEDDTDDIMSPLPFDSKTAGWYDPAQFAGMDFAQLQQFLEDEDEDSPFPEVRASVSNIDDPDMPCLTFRAWFLGLGFCAILSLANLYFSLRYPAPLVTPLVAQIVSYPVGKLLAAVVSARTWRTPKWAQRLGMDDEFSFNPGPFNIKEHTIVILMTNTSGAAAYSFNYTLAAEKFYFQHVPYGLEILILLATQLIGFGMAGIARRFLVWPAAMIWPTNLVFCTVLNTLHAEEDDTSGSITRFRFFTWAFAGAFVWFFFPGEQGLGMLSDIATDSPAAWQASSSPPCRRSHTSAGPRRTTLSSTSSLAYTRASGWASSPLTGPRLPTSAHRS